VPFIRFSRDKRGYESTVVLHAYRGKQGPPRTRVLYLFRSPSHAKVGRRPLEAEVMEALEHTHPDLTFDWSALPREAVDPSKFDRRDREDRSSYRSGRASVRPAVPAVPVPVIIEDDSALGKLLGAQEALRLRSRYGELVQRITRRARTPEERDRLMERAARLNPDDWPDETLSRSAARTFDDDCESVAAELPQRRRGRRGGRQRTGQAGPEGVSRDEGHDHEELVQDAGAGASRDGGRDGADAGGPAAGPAAATGDPGAESESSRLPDAN
jgi:hypothetical protein